VDRLCIVDSGITKSEEERKEEKKEKELLVSQ
jgi:hypothetical protein